MATETKSAEKLETFTLWTFIEKVANLWSKTGSHQMPQWFEPGRGARGGGATLYQRQIVACLHAATCLQILHPMLPACKELSLPVPKFSLNLDRFICNMGSVMEPCPQESLRTSGDFCTHVYRHPVGLNMEVVTWGWGCSCSGRGLVWHA